MTALLIGAALAVAALVYVLLPLFESVVQAPQRGRPGTLVPSESAIDALREIEFDRATGKLSDDDYAALKARYTRSALVEMRAREGASVAAAAHGAVATSVVAEPMSAAPNGNHAADATDAAEAAVLRYRSVRRVCDTCGPRPEPDPAFCSSCGKYLKEACAHCGAPVDQPAARFCGNCGSSLAA